MSGSPSPTDEEACDPNEVLRSRGYRATAQRALIYSAVVQLRHATPESILGVVHQTHPNVNLSTVYRVLSVLEDAGLVTHAHIGSGSPTYHSAANPAHLHFSCQKCGRVQSLPASIADGLKHDVEERLGFRADLTHSAIQGTCAACIAEVD